MLGKHREKTKAFSSIIAKPFIWLKIPPNIVSMLGILLALIAAYFIYLQEYLLAAIFGALAISMDFIDGTVAQKLGKKSYFGNYFETMIDKYVEVILFASLAFHFPIESALLVGLSLIESYAKPRVALVIITDNRDWPAIGEHADKLALFLIGLVTAEFFPIVQGVKTMQAVLTVMILMVLVGGIQRILYAKKLIKEAKEKGKILPYLKKGAGHKPVE